MSANVKQSNFSSCFVNSWEEFKLFILTWGLEQTHKQFLMAKKKKNLKIQQCGLMSPLKSHADGIFGDVPNSRFDVHFFACNQTYKDGKRLIRVNE